MNIRHFVRPLVAALAFTAAAQASATPTLLVNNGVLMGANGVSVDGTLYNVSFVGGSCDSVFSGCSPSAFQFHTLLGAERAILALVDQVLLDGPMGQFDASPKLVNGCGNATDWCYAVVPFASGGTRYDAVAYHNAAAKSGDYRTGLNSGTDYNMVDFNFAVFQLAGSNAAVPEPGTLALFGLALAGLAGRRRRTAAATV